MQFYISIAIVTDFSASNIFDIRVHESLSATHVDGFFSVMSRLIEEFKGEERAFKYEDAHLMLAELIGEDGNVKTDPNLLDRSTEQINVIMNDMIENYEGLEFFILKSDMSIRISSMEEGSIEKIKQYVC